MKSEPSLRQLIEQMQKATREYHHYHASRRPQAVKYRSRQRADEGCSEQFTVAGNDVSRFGMRRLNEEQ